MISRKRLILALNHIEPDRIPFDLDGSAVTGINIKAYQELLVYLGIKKRDFNIRDTMQQLAWVHEDVLEKLKVDTRIITPREPSTWSLEIEEMDNNNKYYTDQYGIGWKMPKNGFYFDPYKHPLVKANIEELDSYPFPNPKDKKRIQGLGRLAKDFHSKGYVVCAPFFFGGFFESGFLLRSYVQFYCDLGGDMKYACYLMDKLLEMEMEYYGFILDEFGEHIDIIMQHNDFAGQDNLLVSPSLYRKFIKPRQKKLYSFLKKKKPSLFIFFHSCGAVYEIIPDLIEVGVDALNPVQVSAANMDTKKLKKEFGKDITFWGGGIDTQRILPYGTTQEVREEVRRRIDDLAPGGGFVFAAVHNIQAGVPPQNIMALWETLQEYGKY